MYTLGDYQQALVVLRGSGGRRAPAVELHLQRVSPDTLVIKRGRDGTPVLGLYLEDDQAGHVTLRVVHWPDGEIAADSIELLAVPS